MFYLEMFYFAGKKGGALFPGKMTSSFKPANHSTGNTCNTTTDLHLGNVHSIALMPACLLLIHLLYLHVGALAMLKSLNMMDTRWCHKLVVLPFALDWSV